MEIRPFQGSNWYRVELGPGADLFGSLRDFLNKEGLREAYVIYCIGSLDRVVLAYPKTPTVPPEIERFTLEGLFEINVIAGELRRQGSEIKVHLHGSVTRAGTEVSGGAINEGTRIFKVAELVIAGVK
jgi:predicted DNA-binding protein with PD1-like motif